MRVMSLNGICDNRMEVGVRFKQTNKKNRTLQGSGIGCTLKPTACSVDITVRTILHVDRSFGIFQTSEEDVTRTAVV
jgi:hypothetical protein